MDPYSGLNFQDREHRAPGAFFLDFGLGDSMGGLGPLLPFLAVGGVARYFGGAGAMQRMMTSSRAAVMRTTSYLARAQQAATTTGSASGRAFWAQYFPQAAFEMPPGRTFVAPAAARNVLNRAGNLAQDVAALGDMPRKRVMSALYDRSRREGYSLFERYGRATGTRIAAAGVAANTFRFLEGIGLLTLGAELGRGLFQSIADWQPATSEGPRVDFGDETFVSSPAAAMTQRQRALMAIHNSQLGVHAALGNEAALMHDV